MSSCRNTIVCAARACWSRRGAVHRVMPARLAAERRRFPVLNPLPRPIVGVLIGGANGAYRMDKRNSRGCCRPHRGCRQAKRRFGCGDTITAYRSRTACCCCASASSGFPARSGTAAGENPYFAYLAVSDALIVTANSVSMVSEAAATGKPVYIVDLPGGDAKFARFHAAMRQAGITRPFAGEIEHWSYPAARRYGASRRSTARPRLSRAPRNRNIPHETGGLLRRDVAPSRPPVPAFPGDRSRRNGDVLCTRRGISACPLAAAGSGRDRHSLDHQDHRADCRGRRGLAGADGPSAVAARPQGARYS